MNNTLNSSNQTNYETNYYSNFEENFNAAVEIVQNTYDYDTLIKLLSSEKILEKQIAALEINEIKSKEDALILTSNLVGQDGKIREAVSFKLSTMALGPKYKEFFLDEEFYGLFLQGVMDINGNVCRQIVSLTQIDEFAKYLCKKLPESIRKILKQIKEIDAQSKQYVISKRNFQLYWCMEALYNIIDLMNTKNIKDIFFETGEFYDYTIREKTAKILAKINNPEFDDLKDKLSNDENYYVRRYLNK